MNEKEPLIATQKLIRSTARQTARTNRVLDDLLRVAIEDTEISPRPDTAQIEKTSEITILASLVLGDTNEG